MEEILPGNKILTYIEFTLIILNAITFSVSKSEKLIRYLMTVWYHQIRFLFIQRVVRLHFIVKIVYPIDEDDFPRIWKRSHLETKLSCTVKLHLSPIKISILSYS